MTSRRKRKAPPSEASITFRDLHGIVLLDKPLGLSSNAALQEARQLFRAAKGGHTGALDPLASGMLPLCFGEATKLAGLLLGSRKAYLAECHLGETTTTADREGEVVCRRPVPPLDARAVETVLSRFRGRIRQVPPLHSAIKKDGEPLYRKARRGEAVQVAPREVDIHVLALESLQGSVLHLRVECGSGTYIRSLAADIGEALGCGAHLGGLRRLWVDPFKSMPMVTLEAIAAAAAQGDAALQRLLLPVEAGVAELPSIRLDVKQAWAVAQGQRIVLARTESSEPHAVFDEHGRLVAMGTIDAEGQLRVVRGFNLPTGQGSSD